jgi:UDP:flavonoid glycosyltransferase YjiC (YdhE family)
MTAAACGVPQLIVTRKPQPALNASRLARTGAGTHLLYSEVPAGRDGVEVLTTRVVNLLTDDAYPAAAARLRAEIEAMPTPADVVRVLEKLV